MLLLGITITFSVIILTFSVIFVTFNVIIAGFFVYFDSMSLNEDKDGDCEEDYVQFGRDILFITSHRSNKYCGVIEGSLVPALPSSGAANVTEDPLANVTPLGSLAVIHKSFNKNSKYCSRQNFKE